MRNKKQKCIMACAAILAAVTGGKRRGDSDRGQYGLCGAGERASANSD